METQSPNNTVPVLRLDFQQLPPEERFEAWRESVSLLFEVEPPPDGPAVASRLTTYHFGSLLLGGVASHGQAFRRSNRLISRAGVDHFLVQVYRRGGTAGSFGKEHASARPGDVLLLDLAQSLDTRAEDFENLTLVVPRPMLAQHLPCPERLHGRVLPRESVPARLLAGHLDMLWQTCAQAAPEEADALGRGVAGMVSAYFAQLPLPEGSPEIEVATGLAIRQYIARHFADPRLTPEVLARRFGLSRARLYRLFKPFGGVAEYIRERRLAWSLAELSRPGRPQRVVDVALAAGFGSEAHFSRVFRQAFGLSPRDAREGAGRAAAAGPREGFDPRIQEWLRRLA